ncbi:hypothetical protein niasHT_011640 [Heterodera trifolii]|uniref:Uncharacterized protein n=1 Tax=Heterodera trifolii TaxID=157864 RepID=A0ABD2LH41_9BILA
MVTKLVSRESIIFDTVLDWEDGGEFVRNVTSKVEIMQATRYEFQLKLRTNCFILNEIGEDLRILLTFTDKWLEVMRVCSPNDDFILSDAELPKWSICDPIRYGLQNKSYELDSELQNIHVKEACPQGTRQSCEPCAGNDEKKDA